MAAKSKDFRALGLRLDPATPFITYLLVKKHISESSEHCIFVSGLPFNIQDDTMHNIFSCFGVTTTIIVHPSRKSAVVVYKDEGGVDGVLEAIYSGTIVEHNATESPEARGLKSWVQEHKAMHPGNAVLQKQLDEWMERYEEAELRRQKEREAEMAEDGWTVVVRSKGRKRAREDDGVSAVSGGVAAAAAAAVAAGKKEKQYHDFYRFQQREKRRDELMDLRKKFEEDRRRIQELRANRNFKPC